MKANELMEVLQAHPNADVVYTTKTKSPRTLDYISAVQVNENGIILIHED